MHARKEVARRCASLPMRGAWVETLAKLRGLFSPHAWGCTDHAAIATLLVALILLGLILWKKIVLGKPTWQGALWFTGGSLAGIALYIFCTECW